MSDSDERKCPYATRRGFLAAAGGLAAAAGSGLAAPAVAATVEAPKPGATARDRPAVEPFFGKHQAGIATPQQTHTYFAAFDLLTRQRGEVIALLQAWTAAAARMARGQTAQPLEGGLKPVLVSDAAAANNDDAYSAPDPSKSAGDSGEALGLPAARLTVTFGFGPGLFSKDGVDRYGLAARRPEALVDLPKFNGDQLVAANTGGDLSVQACADDPQVAFHAVRQLARVAHGVAQIRWTQTGFLAPSAAGATPRNLLGFKDGTQRPAALDQVVWAGDEAPAWLRNGSYLVVRKIRIALEHWDQTPVGFQEQTIGRHKYSGAGIGGKHEFEPLNLAAVDKDGNPVIAENAHVRLATAASNDGAQILRRGYSYNDGTSVTAERWPPWRQGLEYDAGLLFLCYQRDPRAGFVKIFANMAKLDMLNQFVTHVGGGLFACPGGVGEGEFVGQRLFAGA
ncbi:MAG TPA: Dyp-type peroxidase [Candidatus Sulfotelmatobacter sp.]|nr:Dyp-type peroxidase [Candidatus Sulfotelmatobacter sp.]